MRGARLTSPLTVVTRKQVSPYVLFELRSTSPRGNIDDLADAMQVLRHPRAAIAAS